jgi:hypothetical protein
MHLFKERIGEHRLRHDYAATGYGSCRLGPNLLQASDQLDESACSLLNDALREG